MKILHIIDALPDFGGAQALLADLCSGTADEGDRLVHSVCALHGAKGGKHVERLNAAGVEVEFLAGSKYAVAAVFFGLLKRLLRQDFDILHLHLRASSLAAPLYRFMKKAPVAVTVYEARSQRPRTFDVFFSMVAFFVDGFITSFPSTVKRLKERGVRAERIHFIQQTAAIENAGNDHDRCRDALERQYGFTAERGLLLSIARFNRDRRIGTIIEAMRIIAEKRPESLLLMVGDGPEYPRLIRMVRRFRLENHVVFTGFRSDDWNLLPACDVYLTCSDDGMPGIAAVKAMACGRCVVSYNLNPMRPDAMRAETAGAFIVTAGPEAMARETARLLGSPGERREIGSVARRIVGERMGIREYIRAHERLYGALLKERDL
jgi:glycosyltransferase involved in cell wall biosynthesis